jgi:hypothetical protein
MAEKVKKILPHGEFEELAPGLWSLTGSLPMPLRRNMIVYRMADGSLLLHSVIALDDAGMAKLESLGRPSIMIVPASGHRMDAAFYKARYPNLRVISPAASRSKVDQVIKTDATCEDVLPKLGIGLHPMVGFRQGEIGYELPIEGGRALVLCDALANPDHPAGLGGKLVDVVLGGIKTRLGVPRIVRIMLMKEKEAARGAIARLADIKNLSVISVAHGRPVRSDCAGALREAATSI